MNPKKNSSLLAEAIQVPEHVVYRPFVQETVLLNLQTGKYHGINPVGGRMLEVLQRASSLEEAALQLADEYQRPLDEIEQDVCNFCDDLLERGLIQIKGS
jgi:hypothetical protein